MKKKITSVMDLGFSPSKLDTAIRTSFSEVHSQNMNRLNAKVSTEGFKTFSLKDRFRVGK